MFTSLKITSLFTVSLTAAFIIFMGVMVASADWAEPGGAPPNGNVAAPINVGNNGQAKIGGLIVNTGGAPHGLGVLGGGSLDLSGLIRIIDKNGVPASNAEGSEGQVLTRIGTGVAWTGGNNSVAQAFRKYKSNINPKQIIPMGGAPSSAFIPLDNVAPHGSSLFSGSQQGSTGVACNAAEGWRLVGCWIATQGGDADIFPYTNGCITNDVKQGHDVEVSIACIKAGE